MLSTDRQTQTNATKNITSFAKEVTNDIIKLLKKNINEIVLLCKNNRPCYICGKYENNLDHLSCFNVHFLLVPGIK